MSAEEHHNTQHEEADPQKSMKDNPPQERKGIQKYISRAGIIGIVLGAIAGYLYYHYIGCRSGGCPINSNPYLSVLWGAIIGYLFGDMFRTRTSRKK